ncbi:UPF0104 family protein [Leptospira wolffii]|uniref:TIGR00374 family protein n=1 Tax=Leptospira wolffii TaxID=409998 RepID=A0A2M9ZAD0_9LEPT|nr:lysylphosphatidylglycerol synthase transmembrane domain-containing protein [Leptospira wolffii]PJZ65370.1 TIGR00374 family protein [Leptospira wolffii]TGK64751.1 UPF0104 family protein [Leptospira wolffii]TGK76850.1 UPF0104 family protein [Leptospira wolffii]TGK77298.1 UPF0104 family protein [Leptospira wolffii]TGL26693.1 UPF0104 family protein [Leptospira wolffii]
MKKLALGFLISALSLGFLFWNLDLSGFSQIRERWQPIYLIPFLIAIVWGLYLFSWRWYLLLGKKVPFRTSLLSAYIGVGANQFLPARGGDLFRLYFCRQGTDIGYASLVSGIFLEKVLDFSFIFCAGLGALFVLGVNQDKARFILPLLGIVGIFSTLAIIRFFHETLIRWGEALADKFKKKEFFSEKLSPQIRELGSFLTTRNVILYGGLTAATWLFGYAIHYTFLQYLVGIHLSPLETVFIMFCGAVGVMVPSAPSGAGVYHASITSGFVLLGRSSSEGLVYATTVHLGQMVALGILTAILYIYWSFSGKAVAKADS